MLSELTSLCRQVVTVAPRTGVDGYGEPTYGAAVPYRARVVGKVRIVRDQTGKEVVFGQTVYLMAATAISPLDKLTLTTGFVNSTESARTTPPIVAAGRFPGMDGDPHHSVVFLQ